MAKSTYQRKPPFRSFKEVYAIVGDGPTEKIYFDLLKESKRFSSIPQINIKPELPNTKGRGGGYIRVFEKAKELSENHDRVFCLIDMDVVIRENKLQSYAREKMRVEKGGKITVIENNPCFEFWFLLHFEFTAKHFDSCDRVCNEIRRNDRLPGYSKAKEDLPRHYEALEPKLCDACKHSRSIEDQRDIELVSPQHPRCQMHLVLEGLGLCGDSCQYNRS
jgi:hypothetical protein